MIVSDGLFELRKVKAQRLVEERFGQKIPAFLPPYDQFEISQELYKDEELQFSEWLRALHWFRKYISSLGVMVT